MPEQQGKWSSFKLNPEVAFPLSDGFAVATEYSLAAFWDDGRQRDYLKAPNGAIQQVFRLPGSDNVILHHGVHEGGYVGRMTEVMLDSSTRSWGDRLFGREFEDCSRILATANSVGTAAMTEDGTIFLYRYSNSKAESKDPRVRIAVMGDYSVFQGQRLARPILLDCDFDDTPQRRQLHSYPATLKFGEVDATPLGPEPSEFGRLLLAPERELDFEQIEQKKRSLRILTGGRWRYLALPSDQEPRLFPVDTDDAGTCLVVACDDGTVFWWEVGRDCKAAYDLGEKPLHIDLFEGRVLVRGVQSSLLIETGRKLPALDEASDETFLERDLEWLVVGDHNVPVVSD